ncbi:hypothetical protein DHD05_19245 [Arenibacter sp. N53]|nr:hypothetical protein [Arenibacter sp. N53]
MDIIFKSPFPDLLSITKGKTVQSTNKPDTNHIDKFILFIFKLFHLLINSRLPKPMLGTEKLPKLVILESHVHSGNNL